MGANFDDVSPPPRRPGVSVEEYRLEQVEKRLASGAGRFAKQDDRIDQTERKVGRALGGLFVAALAVASGTGALLWQVNSTSRVVEQHEEKLESTAATVSEVKREQVRLNTAVEGIQESLDKKLDRALNPPADPVSGRRRPR